jgi:hypothetical protein
MGPASNPQKNASALLRLNHQEHFPEHFATPSSLVNAENLSQEKSRVRSPGFLLRLAGRHTRGDAIF